MQFLFLYLQSDNSSFITTNEILFCDYLDVTSSSSDPIIINNFYTYPTFPESVTITDFGSTGDTVKFDKQTFLIKQRGITAYVNANIRESTNKLIFILEYVLKNPNATAEKLNSLALP